LDDSKSTNTKFTSQYREEPLEESSRPANLGENEDDDLTNDQQTVQYCPEHSGGLVGYGRPANNDVKKENKLQMKA
jgi:hypothetical protein